MAKNLLEYGDDVVIISYFIIVLVVGFMSSKKSKGDSVSGYFLASRNMHWIPVGASLFASNIGSGHFIGLAGSGAASGIAIGAFELNAVFVLMMLGWLFVPVYMSSGIYTMPEYLRERFGGQRIRIYLSVLALILYVFTKISADLYAGALFIQEAIGQTSEEWLYISVLILLAIAALFTIAGGLTAVIWTDFVQTVLMIIGALILMIISFYRVGGYENMVENYFFASPENVTSRYEKCSKPPVYAMSFFRSIEPGESDLPWTGMVFGITISAVWYWCTDQVIVQRALASKNMIHAKAGCTLAAWLKFFPIWLLVFPGMCARILFPNEVACVEPEKCKEICGSETGCTNIAYIKLVLNLLPTGMRGLMLAVMMAALMSSLTSIFNSSSTIFTIDIWERIRRKQWKKMNMRTIEIEKLIVGRVFVLFLVFVSVIWIPVIQNSASSQLFLYIQSISAFLSPPICAVYILAIFWKRMNEPGAFWGLMIGLVIGLIRFIMEFSYVIPPCGSDKPDPRPEIIKLLVGQIHFLHFGCILFVITLIVSVSVSYLTEPIPDKCLHRLTFNSRFSDQPRVSVREWRNEKDENVLEALERKKSLQNGASGETPEAQSWPWLMLYKICGFKEEGTNQEGPKDPEKTPEQLAVEAAEFMKEDDYHARIVNGFGILALLFATFLWGFYA